ncbi:hypothetical protein DUI87_11070 [Hirundo rustica rustica]|uniref:Uncharacterized protein n=1 Tax=Hirundo rustica rustica TaxID=333673 RepID=A0A3M0KH62_HIRRU|nr:hypothetical protein DUI87_11070 [Hirundo rustica rustica]
MPSGTGRILVRQVIGKCGTLPGIPSTLPRYLRQSSCVSGLVSAGEVMQAEPQPEHEKALAGWYGQSSASASGGNANIHSSPVEEVVVQVELPPE